jgi:hypothetical protein
MDFYLNGREYHGDIVMIDKETQTQYQLNLGNSLQFTAAINEDGIWETDNTEIDPDLVAAAGNYIENLEGFEDVLGELNNLFHQ